MGNIDDQYKNPNMNDKDHLVGQLTTIQVEDVVPTIVLKPGRTPIVFDVKEAQERRLVGESLSSVRERLRQVTKEFAFVTFISL